MYSTLTPIIKDMRASSKPRSSREAANEYLQLIKQIKDILEEKIEQLERELGEQKRRKKNKNKQGAKSGKTINYTTGSTHLHTQKKQVVA